MKPKPRRRQWAMLAAGFAFLTVVPVAAHVMFSRFGFCPADDGFTLAYSRRILDGQIPHRDFIIIRPALSPLIHAPFVAFGGDYTLMACRLFVWFEFAAISWAWTCIVCRIIRPEASAFLRLGLAVTGFVFSAHYFPIMPWHTIDGLFLLSVGIWLCLSGSKPVTYGGLLLVGLAYLCKQNFAVVAPLVVIWFGWSRQPARWLAAATPAILYATFIAVTGGLGDAAVQLTAQTGLFSAGVWRYVSSISFEVAAVLGYLGMRGLLWPKGAARSALVLLMLVPLYAAAALSQGQFTSHAAIDLFGIVLGAATYLALRRSRDNWHIPAFLALLTAWSASISMGYSTPALGTGPLIIVLLAWIVTSRLRAGRSTSAVLVGGFALISVCCFGFARINHIYRDATARQLTHRLDGVLPGAAGIYTNPRTYGYLRDLRDITRTLKNRDYCVLPDAAAWWVKCPQRNPLPMDLPIDLEVAKPQLLARVRNTLESHPAIVILVSRYRTAALSASLSPPISNHVMEYVRANYTRVGRGQYFDIYRRVAR